MDKVRKLRIKRFQGIEDLDIELGRVTVISGPTNAGKSSLVRAIEAIAANKLPAGVCVQDGCGKASVFLDCGRIKVGLVKSRKEGTQYRLLDATLEGGQRFDKIGKNVPQEIVSRLRMADVVFDRGTSRNLNIMRQGERFVVHEPGPVAAKILGHGSGLDVLAVAFRLMTGDIRAKAAEVKKHEPELARLQQILEGLPAAEWKAERLERAVGGVEKAQEGCARLLQHLGLVWGFRRQEERALVTRARIDALEKHMEAGARTYRKLSQEAAGVTAMMAVILRYKLCVARLAQAERTLLEKQSKLKATQSNRKAFLAQLKICPLCGAKMGEGDSNG